MRRGRARLAKLRVAGWALALVFGGAVDSLAAPAVSPDRLEDASSEGDASAAMGDFAWRAFVALDWPALPGERGAPDRGKTLGEPGPRVWETFKSAAETFPIGRDGQRVAPTPWNRHAGPNPCGDADGGKTIAAFKPFAEFNQPSFEAGSPANPLVAQNGEYVRYEARFNPVEFAALAVNGWSQGRDLPDAEHPAQLPIGSIEIKAAWRPLNASDTAAVRARYYVASAVVVDAAKSRAEGRIACATRELALVGLHIVVKTKSKAQWIWSSFEHVDNVPPAGRGDAREPDAKDAGAPYGFFDPARVAKLWPPFGAPDALPVDAHNPPKVAPEPMQIVRRHPVNATLMATNRTYWALPGVKGTVFEHYMLVAAQWPTTSEPAGAENDGAYFPGRPEAPAGSGESYRTIATAQENLVNTVMETYMQEAPSSCMACHQAASNVRGDDFVGILAGVR